MTGPARLQSALVSMFAAVTLLAGSALADPLLVTGSASGTPPPPEVRVVDAMLVGEGGTVQVVAAWATPCAPTRSFVCVAGPDGAATCGSPISRDQCQDGTRVWPVRYALEGDFREDPAGGQLFLRTPSGERRVGVWVRTGAKRIGTIDPGATLTLDRRRAELRLP